MTHFIPTFTSIHLPTSFSFSQPGEMGSSCRCFGCEWLPRWGIAELSKHSRRLALCEGGIPDKSDWKGCGEVSSSSPIAEPLPGNFCLHSQRKELVTSGWMYASSKPNSLGMNPSPSSMRHWDRVGRDLQDHPILCPWKQGHFHYPKLLQALIQPVLHQFQGFLHLPLTSLEV